MAEIEMPPEAVPVRRDPRYSVDPSGSIWRTVPVESRRHKNSPVPRRIRHLYMGTMDRRSPFVRLEATGSKPHSVAQIVLEAFGPARPHPTAIAHFINDDTTDASIGNLMWKVDRKLRARHLADTLPKTASPQPGGEAGVLPPGGAGRSSSS